MARLIAIGDIHGHAAVLSWLLEQITPREGDEFIFLGDYIDRGPDSRGVVDLVLQLGQNYPVQALLGNHEIMLLASVASRSDHRLWLRFGGREALHSYGIRPGEKLDLEQLPREHVQFYGSLHDYYETERFIFVHAAYHPTIPMPQQSSTNLHWVKLPADLAPHYSGKRVFCGHTPDHEIVDRGHIVCLDTGCGVLRGGRLTAMDVHTGTVWQVSCI